MSEGLATFFQTTPWAPLAIAFVVGLGCGWLVWGVKSGDAASDVSGADKAAADSDERKEIVVLRAELEAARALLEDGDNHHEDIGRQMSALDEALKRANGRLKIILRAIKR